MLTADEREALDYAVFGAAGDGHDTFATVEDTVERIIADRPPCDHEAQIRDLLEEREELLTEIVRLQRGNHPAGRALPHLALAEVLTERDAEHEGGGGA